MGHFSGNKEMIAQYSPQLADKRIYKQKTPNCDGAGIQLGLAAGGEAVAAFGTIALEVLGESVNSSAAAAASR